MLIEGKLRNLGDPSSSSQMLVTGVPTPKPHRACKGIQAHHYRRKEKSEVTRYLRQGITGAKEMTDGSHSLPIVPLVGGEVHSERATVGKGIEVCFYEPAKGNHVVTQRTKIMGNEIWLDSAKSVMAQVCVILRY